MTHAKEEQNKPEELSRKEKEIQKLEAKILEKKEWNFRGEISGKQRPKDALLNEDLDFKLGTQPVSSLSKVTPNFSQSKTHSKRVFFSFWSCLICHLLILKKQEKFTESLIEVIQRRVNDEAWDDRRQFIGTEAIKENYRDEEELNFEKAKKGLGEEYEEQYKEEVLGISSEKKEDKVHVELRELFGKLNYYLDSMTNLSFTPKPIEKAKKGGLPKDALAIKVEEKTPIFISTKSAKTVNEVEGDKKEKEIRKEADLNPEEKKSIHSGLKRKLRNRLKAKKEKLLVKRLSNAGQTKHDYNVVAKSMKKAEKERERSGISSVKFTKSSQFFSNIQKSVVISDFFEVLNHLNWGNRTRETSRNPKRKSTTNYKGRGLFLNN